MLFETARLRVLALGDEHVDAMVDVYGDRDAMRHVDDGEPLDRATCVEWVAVTRRNVEARGYGMCALVEGARVVGFMGLVHPGGQDEAELKYALRRADWGRGLATEAGAGMLAWGARAHGLREVIATVAPSNAASQRVLAKLGMTRGDDRADGTRVFYWNATS